MKLNSFLSIFALLLGGCVSILPMQSERYAPPGYSVVPVGTISVSRLLKYGGKVAEAELVVQSDEYGNTILSAGEGEEVGGIAIFLDARARQDLLENLGDIRALGALAGGDAALPEKYFDAIASWPVPGVANTVRLAYLGDRFGLPWLCLIEMSGYDRPTVLATVAGRPEGRRELSLLLSPEDVDSLIQLVERMNPDAS